MIDTSPIFNIDWYKHGHYFQYPSDTTKVFSNWTARASRVEGQHHVVWFGFTYFAKKYLEQEFNQNFFGRSWHSILATYVDLVRNSLGIKNPELTHLRKLHELGYLPLDFYALPEGVSVPLNVPMMVVTNTHPAFFWLPNYLETLISNILWKPTTSATTAQRYKRIFVKYAKEAGERDLSFCDFQGHDFSFRGMSGLEDAVLSGLGHLTSFRGTDTVPAILAARRYYNAPPDCGTSIPATEHSVMCAGTQDGEFETFEHLLREVYPNGMLSVVSDTWDLWKVCTEYIPRLKELILARDGKLVVRPDSGDPVKIMCGDPDRVGPAHYGVLRLLASGMGTEKGGGNLPMIRKAGAIYGDSITPDRCDQILYRTTRELKLSPYNVVLGIGSFTYEFTTRDMYGMAMKATAVVRNGQLVAIFKKPVTDDGEKFSHHGIPAVYETDSSTMDHPEYFVKQDALMGDLEYCAFDKVWSNGELLIDPSWDEIRRRVSV